MPQLDVNTFLPQIVWLVITFAALFLLMWRVAVPRIADVLETRQRRIDDNLDKAVESKKEAEQTLAAYEQAIAEAHAGANTHIAEAAARMSAEAAEREAKLAEDLSARIAAAENEIAKAVDDAMNNIRAATIEVAAAALERLTGEAPGEKAVAKVIDNALKPEDR
ncbi:MAG: F0F1 ATP synthase subunit B' [Rhodospirillaceae bacterium]|jgi:F-type H+-transporting ATPase subunit b|nr:F0F1 ATP synthase subunit B' [Rhodospirillaceae bacterium]|tara:strand:+ start:2092 stop:2586 length:495 start_codon:yes stop_codon:yes gene_type:complete